ncbi:hypothetical protein JXA48_02635 [Candidatus Woesearchaeota archaeon]|nr:hypothetical protein [Candidatus Woesearchaeota archaeon]
MVENFLQKIEESYPQHFTQIKTILENENYHLLLNLDIEDDSKIKIIRTIFSKNYVNIFRTRKARELQMQIINKIKSYITTDYAKELILKFFPTTNIDEIKKRQNISEIASNNYKSVKDSIELVRTFIKNISNVKYSSLKRRNGVVIAFADDSLYSDMKNILSKKFYITFIESEHDIMSIDHYEQIRFIPGKNDSFNSLIEQLPQATTLLGTPSLEDVAPEFITDLVEENKLVIDSLYSLDSLIKLKSLPDKPSSTVLTKQKFSEIEPLIYSLAKELEKLIQSQISKAAFSGNTLMGVISNKKSLIDLLDVSSQEIIRSKKQEIMKSASDILGSGTSELFSVDYIGNVSVDESQLDLIKQQFLISQEQNFTKHKQLTALSAKELIENLPFVVEEVYGLDLFLAIGNFIFDYDLERPFISEKGLSFVYGRNLNITNAVPVEYYIGTAHGNSNTDNITVLTGANSGGKTTLLELLAQVQLLTQMGLFVPAKQARVGIIEELYYFSKNKGSLNAGAFETLLKQFAEINNDNSPRLVLADEIESVTEPSVATKIIEGIIDHLSVQQRTMMVLVTHMGNELSPSINCRFDGIEAKGLDNDLNLVVDRNPIIGRLARSTPQLIVERLARKESNIFYSNLHRSMTLN